MNARRFTVLDVVSRLVIAILFIFFISIVTRFFTRQILIEELEMNNGFTRMVFFDAHKEILDQHVDINWEAEFPFIDESNQIQPEQNQFWFSRILEKFDSLIKGLEKKIVIYATDYVILYSRFTEMANLYEKSIGWNLVSYEEYNGVINLDGGFLTTLEKRRDVSENVASISSLKSFLDEREIGLFYIQIPSKICRQDEEISGVIDFSNQNADIFLSGLKEHQIDYLDLRDILHQEGLNHHELFYKTDHHWKAETGLWAAGIISKNLNDRYGFNIDLEFLNPTNYDFSVYHDWFLGSHGKKVTLSQADPEDISLIYPKFNVDMSLRIPERNIDMTGEFDIIYDRSQITQKDYYQFNPYAAYSYSDNAFSSFRNNLILEERKVLLIGDSNDNSILPFLALGVKSLDSLDLRTFSGSLRSIIDEISYDLVLVLYYPGAIGEINYWSHDSFFDFR